MLEQNGWINLEQKLELEQLLLKAVEQQSKVTVSAFSST